MRKTIYFSLILLLGCTSFKSTHKSKEPIVYLLPEVAEEKAMEHVKEMIKYKGDSVNFYVGFGMHNSTDTFLLTINTYYNSLNTKSPLYRLIYASNRFVKVGKMRFPIIYTEDHWFSGIVNSKNTGGGIKREMPLGRCFSIVFTGHSYEKGKVIWTGWAGG